MATDSVINTTNFAFRNVPLKGLYNTCYTTKAGITNTVNFSQCKWFKRSDRPKVFSTTTGTTNFSFETMYYDKGTKFYYGIKINDTSASDGVRYDFPFLVSYASSYQSRDATGLSDDTPYLSCTSATANYGYTWSSWRKNGSTGTVVSTSQNFLFYYNNSNQSTTTTLWAVYSGG